MFSVKLKNGELMDFDGQCKKVDYSDPRYTVFLNESNGKRLSLALIPIENILAIINSPKIQEYDSIPSNSGVLATDISLPVKESTDI